MNPTNEQELDEILSMLGERHIMVEHRLIHVGMPERNGKNIETRNAKQAIIDWHNKQIEELLDRLEAHWTPALVPDGEHPDGKSESEVVPLSALQAERAKLKEVK